MDEVKAYQRLHARLVLAPRQIDWEYFNDELEIGDDIYRYIKLIDLEEFEDTEPYAYRYLTLEFFSTSGLSSGLISDLAHVVIHKYISQMIFDKKESNKVSEQQVFILWSISHDKPVTMLQYLKDTLFDIRNDTRRGPNLGHVVSKLAEYFGVDIDEPPIRAKQMSQKYL
ncbi:pentatricopeptide (PPR) repeat-containing protein [Striga asiatica]|uniref:Pentatricopeptide (PPR) repeat-containing protein n=1 Tax=Striga asiatica TaxID=4170 RepID=A0A5A7RCQ3_STRAF|nr:pentatricopeptide (PPR) repeat-containing protein [Striga asiatica]